MNTRILLLNTNGLRCEQDNKIIQLIEFCQQKEISIAILSETNSKWDIIIKEKME